MRIRKKKWVNPFIEQEQKYIVKDQRLKGNWLKSFPYRKLYLEIGMGMGDFIVGSAQRDRSILYVGLEKEATCVAKSVIKAQENKVENLRVILNGADEILDYFDKEVDRIYLHFSDPWPKKAHAKRRLTYHTYLAKYRKILQDEGEIIFKTDNSSLFEFSLQEFLNCGWRLDDISVDYHRHPNDDIMTGYEKKFVELGQPIYFAVFKKCA